MFLSHLSLLYDLILRIPLLLINSRQSYLNFIFSYKNIQKNTRRNTGINNKKQIYKKIN
ncbi:hypothetical protein Cyast_1606 [Cyanobacterium stanieri PCC 7202]|uniref:Uncharacterized protein n=1 Tax=Cyanobacterium stanieri (strain ATCC 29140 / PCC 7202) TaxID=292563 RepID=K9YM59_CYASC|nr:hypothetical protein Cyast_1606 [Cyanobacterium stanieri PCC 7202]